MASPTFVAAGTEAHDGLGGSVVPGMPAGATTDDLLLLVIESLGEDADADAPPTGGDWTLIGTVVSDTVSSADTRCTVYWAWYDAEIDRVVPKNGNHTLAVITAWRGVDTSTPFDVASVSSSSAIGDTTVAITGLTTVNDGCMIVAISNAGDNQLYSEWANASLESITERVDVNTSSGSDGSIHMASGVKTESGVVSTTTATCSSTEREANWCIALRPVGAGGGGSSSGQGGEPLATLKDTLEVTTGGEMLAVLQAQGATSGEVVGALNELNGTSGVEFEKAYKTYLGSL